MYQGGGQQYQLGRPNILANFRVKWLIGCQYPFRDLDHLPGNPLNDNLPI